MVLTCICRSRRGHRSGARRPLSSRCLQPHTFPATFRKQFGCTFALNILTHLPSIISTHPLPNSMKSPPPPPPQAVMRFQKCCRAETQNRHVYTGRQSGSSASQRSRRRWATATGSWKKLSWRACCSRWAWCCMTFRYIIE